jgi:quercetin dioxygenase-like cupin family protein
VTADPTATPSPPEPRSYDAELEGYAWLPRMLDKARLTLAGRAGRHLFGCPVDHTCLARLGGVAPDEVLDLVARHPDDRDVLAALRARGIPPAEEAWFDAPAVEDELQADGAYLRVRHRAQLEGGEFAGEDHGAGVSVLLIDAAPGEEEAPHAHPVEEVVVVTAGRATFFLGERQARVVRPDEVVRIPAGVTHRFAVAADGERFRAVAAHGASRIVRELG